MQISAANTFAPTRAASNGIPFSQNVQDRDVIPAETVTLNNVSVNGGKLETPDVKVLGNKAIIFGGMMLGMKPDPKYTIQPNADGTFVFPEGSKGFTAANSFATVAATVNKFNSVLGGLTDGKQQINWAFGEKQLGVSPETGEYPNAFYSRNDKGVNFFHYKTQSTGDSGEVASHETGHAILDALHPGFLEGAGPETGAFHEAFGDCVAALMTLGNEKAVDKLVEQTGGGDISSKRNLLSDMGEGFGHALGMEGGIRTMLNGLTYADPTTLPQQGDDTHLGSEVHDFARLWAGAFYDVIDGISDANRAAGMSPKQALLAAGEEGWKLMVGQLLEAPKTSETTFKQMAVHLTDADAKYNNGSRGDLIKSVMVKRGLMSADQGVSERQMSFAEAAPRPDTFFFGGDAGQLAGVKMNTVSEGGFGFVDSGSTVNDEAAKGAKMMLANGQVLFTDTVPTLGQILKADGSHFSAYVMPNAEGQKEFHRVPIAF